MLFFAMLFLLGNSFSLFLFHLLPFSIGVIDGPHCEAGHGNSAEEH